MPTSLYVIHDLASAAPAGGRRRAGVSTLVGEAVLFLRDTLLEPVAL